MQPRLQHRQQLRGVAAVCEIRRDGLHAQPHGLEFLDLQHPRHVVVVVVPPPAVRRGVGRRHQPLFLHPQQRTAGKPAGPRRLGDLKQLFRLIRHIFSLPKPLLRSRVNGV